MFQENFANVLSKKADTGHFKPEGRDLTTQSRQICTVAVVTCNNLGELIWQL